MTRHERRQHIESMSTQDLMDIFAWRAGFMSATAADVTYFSAEDRVDMICDLLDEEELWDGEA